MSFGEGELLSLWLMHRSRMAQMKSRYVISIPRYWHTILGGEMCISKRPMKLATGPIFFIGLTYFFFAPKG